MTNGNETLMNAITHPIQEFHLPEHLACPKPTEERNLLRDEVRLLVTTGSRQTAHTTFRHLDTYLQPGNVLVVNISATRPSALPILLPDGRPGVMHLSNPINDR